MHTVRSAFALAAGAALAAASTHDSSTLTAGPSATQVAKAHKRAESSALPLTEYTFSYADIPYQVNPYNSGRGPQSGYNICNSTTSGADSQCQTLVANNISDFCLWGSPTVGNTSTIGDIEAAVVAYCTTDQHGARVFPDGAITGLQVLRTSAYTQWTGHIDMTALGLAADDTGGELDPHGADLAGNPLGGLVYSFGLPSGDNKTEVQVIEWNNFVGAGTFCLKLCDPSVTSPNYCENKYDLLGCSYNMPAAYEDKVFLECDADLQDVVGTYTGSDGKTTTWSQPTELAADATVPWTPRVPSSSNCVTHTSADLFPATLLGYQSTSAPSSSGGSSGSKSGSASGAANTGGSSSKNSSDAGSGAPSDLLAVSVSLSTLAILVGGIVALA
ncbi:hypothetical protein JCM8097_007842 [Rhodosporidiobolus ruineniae]